MYHCDMHKLTIDVPQSYIHKLTSDVLQSYTQVDKWCTTELYTSCTTELYTSDVPLSYTKVDKRWTTVTVDKWCKQVDKWSTKNYTQLHSLFDKWFITELYTCWHVMYHKTIH